MGNIFFMTEKIHDIPTGGDAGGQSPEAISVVLTEEQKKQIERDPRLTTLTQNPENLKALQTMFNENTQVFSALDNPVAQTKLKEHSLKWQGYWRMASNGEDFEKLALLSSEEMGKLDAKIQEELEKYMDNKLNKTQEKVVSIQKESKRLDETMASQQEEWKRLDETVVSIDRWNDEKKETVAWRDILKDLKKETVISDTDLNTWKKEKHREIVEIDSKLESLSHSTSQAFESLLGSGKSHIESELLIARDDANNPVNDTLRKNGVLDKDIRSEKYDDLRRASIIVSQESYLRKNGYIRDEESFNSAISEIKKLGIVPPIVDTKNFAQHIDSRFPKTEATERAKQEIRTSIASGNIGTLYYDGKWEKYTLIDRDGKTSKEVYMDPPETRVIWNQFSIRRETPKRELSENEKQKRAFEKNIMASIKDMKNNPFIGALAHVNFVDTFDQAEKSTDPSKQLQCTYAWLKQKEASIIERIQTSEQSGEIAEVSALRSGLEQVQGQVRKIEELAIAYQKIIVKWWESQESVSPDQFDTIARSNLSWLGENYFDRMGPGAQDTLDRIIGAINTNRKKADQIDLADHILTAEEKTNLISVLNEFGGVHDVLTSGDQLPIFQKKIAGLLILNSDNTGSVENITHRTIGAIKTWKKNRV